MVSLELEWSLEIKMTTTGYNGCLAGIAATKPTLTVIILFVVGGDSPFLREP